MKFSPIVEFFPTYDVKYNSVFERGNSNSASLKSALWEKQGVYAFYNSEGEIIYVGRSTTNLWRRMKRSFEKERSRYARFYVEHARDRFLNGTFRKIRRKPVALSSVAYLFSAYDIAKDSVVAAEQLVIRLIPNDLINLKIEGNKKRSGAQRGAANRTPKAGKR